MEPTKESINIHLSETANELIIRHGKAPDIKDPKPIGFSGNIKAPGEFLSKRKHLLDKDKCTLIVGVEAGQLRFIMNERDVFGDEIEGHLKKNKIFADFGINTEKTYTDKGLAKFLRQNIYYFAHPEQNHAVVNSLMNFSATVTTVIENTQSNRGDVKKLLDKKVNTDIPESFVMKAPLFTGEDILTFDVLIGAEATSTDVKFFLESPELFKIELEQKEVILNREVENFKSFGCPILYV